MAFTTVFFLFAVMPASVAGYYLIKLLGNRNEKWSDWLSNLFLVLCKSFAFMDGPDWRELPF